MNETAEKIKNKEEILEIGEFADKKNREYVHKGSDASEVDRAGLLFSLVKRYMHNVKFHPTTVEIWRS